MVHRIAVVGTGISGLAAAWALHRRPDRFDVQVYEKDAHVGGNAVTIDVPQRDGSTATVDVAVTVCVPKVYHHVIAAMEACGVERVPTEYSVAVHHGGDVHAHGPDSSLRTRLAADFDRFAQVLAVLNRFNMPVTNPTILRAAANPFNYVSIGRVLDLWRVSGEFRVKVLKPMVVSFALAADVFAMPASLFSRYLGFLDVERPSPMLTWRGSTRAFFGNLTASFADRIHTGREVTRIVRDSGGVTVHDASGGADRFDQVILACNADHALRLLSEPSRAERAILGRVRYETAVHGDVVVHTDATVLPDDQAVAAGRSTVVRQYGAAADNYEVTYVLNNLQPWLDGTACLATYNAAGPIDDDAVLARTSFRHVVHDVRQNAFLANVMRFVQGGRRTWFCGAHTMVNSQEHCFVSGLAVARQLGADYPFPDNAPAVRWFNFYGRTAHGRSFRRVADNSADR